jgi:hypothetical protein
MTTELELYTITLPSKGRYYGDKLPGGKLQITPWTVAQEDTIDRMGMDDDSLGSLRQMVENNVRWASGFTYEDLLVTDHYFILLQLRCLSLTPFMTFPHMCPKCKTDSAVQIDISGAEVRVPDDTDTDTEPFSCFLPRKKVEIGVRFLRIGDEFSAEKYSKETVVKSPATERKFIYARQIVSVGGQSLPIGEKMAFVASLSMLDLEVLKNKLLKKQTGVTGVFKATCENCKTEDKTWMPSLHVRFFRPLSIDIERAAGVAEKSSTSDKLSG